MLNIVLCYWDTESYCNIDDFFFLSVMFLDSVFHVVVPTV